MSVCKMREPKNGLYLTGHDIESWQTSFGKILRESGESKSGNDFLEDVKNISILLTEKCNLRCTYCYQSHEDHEKGKTMTKETAKKIVDFLLDDKKCNGYISSEKTQAIILDMLGGEPFVAVDVLDYFVDYFKTKAVSIGHPWGFNYMISISTNGTLYHTEKVQRFLEKNEGRVSIGFSIDGNKQLHDSCRLFPDGSGSYDLVKKNAETWIRNTYNPHSKVTLAPENLKYMKESIIHLWNMGINFISANPIYEHNWTHAQAKLFYDQLIEIADYLIESERYRVFWTSLFSEYIGKENESDMNYCGGTGNMLAIGHDGQCYPCLRYTKQSLKGQQNPIQIGDIYKGLNDPDKDMNLIELKAVTMSSQSDDKCNNCKISSGCGTCSAYNYQVNGTANKRVANICLMHQARILANSYYWNKLYKKLGIDKHFDLNIPKEWAIEIISEKEYLDLNSL